MALKRRLPTTLNRRYSLARVPDAGLRSGNPPFERFCTIGERDCGLCGEGFFVSGEGGFGAQGLRFEADGFERGAPGFEPPEVDEEEPHAGDAGFLFRCCTNGLLGAGNRVLRASNLNSVVVPNAALPTPTVTTFVCDAAVPQIRAYVNGALVTTVAQPLVTLTRTAPFRVSGFVASLGLPANGVMDEFRMFNRALSATEIADTWNTTLSPSAPLETWRQTHFGSPANTSNGADLFDFDGDGLVNLLEYAFGQNPT